MKPLTKEQEYYIESFLGKMWYLRKYDDRFNRLEWEVIRETFIEILYRKEYHEGYSEWLNSLEETFKLVDDLDAMFVEGVKTNAILEYLNKLKNQQKQII